MPRDKAIKWMRQLRKSDQDKESKPFKTENTTTAIKATRTTTKITAAAAATYFEYV